MSGALFPAPERWEEIPLPHSLMESLSIAFDVLPFSLSKSATVDDEVADFTQNGGWRKIDKLFPLLPIRVDGWLLYHGVKFCENWIASLRHCTAHVKVSDLPSCGGNN